MSSHNTTNPNRGVAMGHVTEPPDPNEHLLEQFLSRKNMQTAWKRVKANKGAAGIDQMSIDDFAAFAREHWLKIREIATGRHLPALSR